MFMELERPEHHVNILQIVMFSSDDLKCEE